MAKVINEGIWACTVLGGEVGEDDKQIVRVRIHVMITEGDDKGRKVTYEDQVNFRSAKYIAQSAKAVGWQGGRLEQTFRKDVEAWIARTGGASTVEIKHVEVKSGKNAGSIWAKPNSIGRGSRPLAPPSRAAADDADEAMRAALAEEETGSHSYPARGDAGGGYDDPPPPGDSDVPFIFCSFSEPSPIARHLRGGL